MTNAIQILLNAILMSCCALIGKKLSAQYINRCYQLKEIENRLARLETQIIFNRNAMQQALVNSVDCQKNSIIDRILHDIAIELKQSTQTASRFDEIWKQKVLAHMRDNGIQELERDYVIELGSYLQNTDSMQQAKGFQIVRQAIRNCYAEANDNKKKQCDLNLKLSLMAGLILTIILS